MRDYLYGDPAMILEGEERRKRGCYACALSKRGEKDGKVRSYCDAEMPGYPDNEVDRCLMGRRVWQSK